jgi:hypothetical protein
MIGILFSVIEIRTILCVQRFFCPGVPLKSHPLCYKMYLFTIT